MNEIVELWKKEHQILLDELKAMDKKLCEKRHAPETQKLLDQFLRLLEKIKVHATNEETNIYPQLRALLEKSYLKTLSIQHDAVEKSALQVGAQISNLEKHENEKTRKLAVDYSCKIIGLIKNTLLWRKTLHF